MNEDSDGVVKAQNYREMAKTATSAATKAGLLRLAGRHEGMGSPDETGGGMVETADKADETSGGVESV
jgi:hypothetical protein